MTDDFTLQPASPTIRLTVWLLVVLFVAAASGSYVGKTEIVARGQGKVIPSGRVRVVQPQTDGKITSIRASEGEAVRQGHLLIEMDGTAARSEIKRISSEIARQTEELEVARAILTPLGIIDPASGDFVRAGQASLPRGASAETGALVAAVLTALSDRIAEFDAQSLRLDKSREAQAARIVKARAEADIIARRFASAETLKDHGTISESDYLERQRLLNAATNETVIAEREFSGLAAEAQAVARQRQSAISEVRSTYRKQLNAADLALQALKAEMNAADRRLSDLSIVAPVSGQVENLSVFTVGGFVEAGATLMSIVPSGDGIEVEAFFDNRDIGFLELGQRAFIKFDAFPAERFGIVRGTVTHVGADAREVSPGNWAYAVRLRLDQTSIRVGERLAAFAPGMTATVDVITGERRLISYFFEPVLKAVQDSFGER